MRTSRLESRITNETELIQMYLAPLAVGAPGAFGLKDDAALITMDPGFDLVVSNDPVIAGVHFFADDAPQDIAWKALAVNVSDLAAKAAEPFAYTMALAFPDAPRRDWMTAFCAGLREAQAAFGCTLIGGDTDRTTGPLSIGITAVGRIPAGKLVRRNGAKIGDHVFVTGTIGDAALGLKLRYDVDALNLDEEHRRFLLSRYLRPAPRLAMAPVLRSNASASLDVSDGLLKDAARLAAGASASLEIASLAIPLSAAARAAFSQNAELMQAIATGGDDYEILCAVAAENRDAFCAAAAQEQTLVTEIGTLRRGSGVTLVLPSGQAFAPPHTGYDHFGRA
jgi:thiamine-monophosphate kinase